MEALTTPAAPSLPGRVLRFGFVGASGAVVNLGLLAILVYLVHLHPVWAALLSIEASTIWNHHWNRRWTWRDRSGVSHTLWRYHVVTAGAVAVQWLAVIVGTVLLGVPAVLAAAAGIALASVSNYLGNDRFSFSTTRPVPATAWQGNRRALTYFGVALLLLVGAAVLWHPWDTYVMQESTHAFLVDGVTPYETAREAPDHIFPGATLPAVAQWYAYPPLPLLLLSATYWPAASGALASPALARVLVKLPILIATLALPLAAGRFLARTPGATAAAGLESSRLVERALLLNPLILLVAVVWGQFEAITLLALIGSFAALRRNRLGLAGGLWGTALLIKILPVYLAPLLAIHLWRRFGTRGMIRFFAVGSAVFGLVSLPFLLIEPVGFYQQVLGMHLGRPPARFAPLSAVYHVAKWATAAGLVQLPVSAIIDALSLGSFLLTISAILLVALAATRWPANEAALLWGAGITMLAALLTTKVLNEQYLVLPIGLLAIAAFHPQGAVSPAAFGSCRTLLKWGPAAVVVASLIDNYHFLTFIAPDVLHALTGSNAANLAAGLAWSAGLSLLQLERGLDLVVGALLVAVFVSVLPALRHVVSDAAAALATVLPTRPVPRVRRDVVLAHTVLLAIVFPVFAVGFAPDGHATDDAAMHAPLGDEQLLLATYTTSWMNPAQDPDIRAGTWDNARTTPEIGYYTVNARRASEDMSSMHTVGLHGVVIKYETPYERQANSAAEAARAHGMPYALHVDLSDPDRRIPLTADHIDDAARLLRGPGLDYWNGDGLLGVGAAHHPVLFVDGVPEVGYTFSAAEIRYVASLPGTSGASDAAPTTAAAPDTVQDLFASTPAAAEWRTLYRKAQAAWWDDALQRAGVPEDAVIVVSGVPVLAIPATHGTWLQRGSPDPIGFEVADLGDGPLDPAELRRAWTGAAEADTILVPWNQHDQGRAVEPTIEHGDGMLRAATSLARR